MQFDCSTDTIAPDLTTLLLIGGTGALQLTSGTTAQRPGTAGAGAIRWNTSLTTPAIEYFDGTTWNAIGSGGTTYTAGTGISITTGVIANTGVTSNVAGTNITVSGATGAVTIGTSTTPSFSTVTSTVATGTAPFTVTSTTNVPNLNASSLSGATFASPGTIGSTTPGTATFTTLNASGLVTIGATAGYSDTGILATSTSSIAGYNQFIVQNTNSGTTSSTNYNVSNNLASATTNFGEFGMNSSGFTGTGSFNAAGMVYLASATTDLAIGTYGSNAIHFVVNSGTTDVFTMGTAGQMAIGGSYGTSGQVFTSGGPSAAASWTTVTGGGGLATTDDTTTNATYYPVVVTSAGGSTAKTSSTKITFNPSTGTLSSTIFNSLSDKRAKKNIRELGYGLADVLKLTGHKYEMVDGGNTSIGLIAQDVMQHIPEVVSTNVDGMMGINYPVLTAVLIEAIKDLTARLAILEAKQ